MTTIYLSSTYEDLKEHRRKVFELLKKSGYEVTAMEEYVATDKRPVQKCLDDVVLSDIYVGLFAFRYGYVPPADHDNPDKLSITELELRHAERLGKPCLIFFAKDDEWPGKYFDAVSGENERGQRITELRADLGKEWTASFFSQPYELAALVQAAIAKKVEENRTELAQSETAESGPQVSWSIEKKGSPYPGLMHFTRKYAAVFFGRDAEIQEVLDRIPQNPFMLISGDSGVGKSSFVDAGILPRLEESGLPGSKSVLSARMVPSQGETPFDAMLWALKTIVVKAGLNPADVGEDLTKDPGALEQRLHQIVSQGMQQETLVLFIDQMEELFTAHEAKGSSEFLSALHAAAERGALRVIATIRSDYLHHCLADTMLDVLRSAGHYPLGRVEPWMMHDMIVKPARCAGLHIDNTLAARLIQDTGADPGNLPYLAFALDRLFKQRDDISLSEQAYNAFGGVSGAITEHVREVEASLRKQHGKKSADALLPRLFQALVVVEKENLPVRSQVRKSAFANDLKPVVEMLIEERLLTTEDEGENSKVSVAHEKLFEGWPRLERWIADNQNDLWTKGQLTAEAWEWAAEKVRLEEDPEKWKKVEPGLLQEGARWRKTREWLKHSNLKHEGVTADYIKHCEDIAKNARKTSFAIGGSVMLFLVALAAYAVVWFPYTNSAHLNEKVVGWRGQPVEDDKLYIGGEKENLSGSFVWLKRHFLKPKKEHWIRVTAPGHIDWFERVRPLEADETIELRVTLYPDAKPPPQMVHIQKDKFQMGDPEGDMNERHVRTVTFNEDFEIGKYEVTFAEYDAFAHETKRELPDDRGWGRGSRPVVNVSWNDAVAYAQWLSKHNGLKEPHHYRLPSEAEWVYAARAGKPTKYWWGDEIKQDGKVWAICNSCGSLWEGAYKTAPVGSFEQNPYGLHDTAGNVWEWVQDCYANSYEGAPDDGAAREHDDSGGCEKRVLHGGSWGTEPHDLRSANRAWYRPDSGGSGFGFRLARTL